MNKIIFASVFCLVLGLKANAQEQQSPSEVFAPAEGEHSLLIFNPAEQSFSNQALDTEDLILQGPGHGGSHGGGHGPGHGGGHGPGHGGGHGPGHGGGHHGPWNPYPGWHDGWRWNRNWHPGWWHLGMVFPPWIWIDVPAGYWQCTAFNSGMQAFSAIGPDVEQAAYGALYNCGGPNYEQMGCYIPQGYCQLR